MGTPDTRRLGSVESFGTLWSKFREMVVRAPAPSLEREKDNEPNLRVHALVRSTGTGILFGRPFRFAKGTSRATLAARATTVTTLHRSGVIAERVIIEFPSPKKEIRGWGAEYFFFCKDDRLPIGVDLRTLAPAPEQELVAACKTTVAQTPDPTDTVAACVRERKEAHYATKPQFSIRVGGAEIACDPLRHFIIRRLVVVPGDMYPRIWAQPHVSGPRLYEVFNGVSIPIEKYVFKDLAQRAQSSPTAKAYLDRIVAANKKGDVVPAVELITAVLDGKIP